MVSCRVLNARGWHPRPDSVWLVVSPEKPVVELLKPTARQSDILPVRKVIWRIQSLTVWRQACVEASQCPAPRHPGQQLSPAADPAE